MSPKLAVEALSQPRLVVFLASMLPGLLLWYVAAVYARMRPTAEPAMLAAFGGMAAALIAGVVEIAVQPSADGMRPLPYRAGVSAFAVAGLIEELAKLLVVLFLVRQADPLARASFQRADVVGLSAIAGAGFAMLENLFYLVANNDWSTVAMVRAVLAVPMHAACGVVMGAFVAATLGRRAAAVPLLAGAWLLAAALHGLYDFPLFVLGGGAPDARPALASDLAMALMLLASVVLIATCAIVAVRHVGRAALPHAVPGAIARLEPSPRRSIMLTIVGAGVMVLGVALAIAVLDGISGVARTIAPEAPEVVALALAVFPLALGATMIALARAQARADIAHGTLHG
jgi:RsiW-degrading membrane proteinase PrsW (M82 family)